MATGSNTDALLRKSKLPIGQQTKRPRTSDGSDKCYTCKCQKCDENIDENVTCSGCQLQFCLNCADISPRLHECIINGELDNFHWQCRSCKATFPSLQHITEVLNDIKITHDDRMTNIETRMSNIEQNTKGEIQNNVQNMKDDIISQLRGDITSIVVDQTKEMDERRKRENNLVIFNLPEAQHSTNLENKKDDEDRIKKISICLGLDNLEIYSSFRLGKKQPNVTRPLKVILVNKSQQKYLLANAKHIPAKTENEFKQVFLVRDMTVQQRKDRKKIQEERRQNQIEQPQNIPMETDKDRSRQLPETEAKINRSIRTSSPVYVDASFAFSQINRFSESQREQPLMNETIIAGALTPDRDNPMNETNLERRRRENLIQEMDPDDEA